MCCTERDGTCEFSTFRVLRSANVRNIFALLWTGRSLWEKNSSDIVLDLLKFILNGRNRAIMSRKGYSSLIQREFPYLIGPDAHLLQI